MRLNTVSFFKHFKEYVIYRECLHPHFVNVTVIKKFMKVFEKDTVLSKYDFIKAIMII